MSGPCTECGQDSSEARKGGGLWLPPDSSPAMAAYLATGMRPPIALCADCRTDQDDGRSPWRSA